MSLLLTAALSKRDRTDLPPHVLDIVAGMDVSECTRAQYRREIRVFLAWLGADPIRPNTLVAFKGHLKGRTDISVGTAAKYLAVARSFLRELYRLQLIPVDVTANVRGIRVTREHKRQPVTDDEVKRVLAHLASDSIDARARVVIGLMYYQGLRRVEVARLRVEDYDRDARTVRVLGKGKDDYECVNLHPRTVEILAQYLSATGLKRGPLFPSPAGDGQSLSSNAIWRIAMRVHRTVGIGDRNIHGWRKAFTTRLIRSGLNLLEVQGFTRHASLGMLQVYYQRIEREKTLPVYYGAFD